MWKKFECLSSQQGNNGWVPSSPLLKGAKEMSNTWHIFDAPDFRFCGSVESLEVEIQTGAKTRLEVTAGFLALPRSDHHGILPRGPLAETPTERSAGQEVIRGPIGGACVF